MATNYTIGEDSAQHLKRTASSGKLASFYLFSDAAGRDAGLVAARASNESSKAAVSLGQKERKARKLKQFCRGIVIKDRDGKLVFIRYQGNVSIKLLETLLTRRMPRDSGFKANAKAVAARLKTARVLDKKAMTAAGSMDDALRELGIDTAAAAEGEDSTVSALLGTLEADALSEASFQAEFDDSIAETFAPVAALLGVDTGGRKKASELAPLITRVLKTRGKEVVALVLASEEASAAAAEIVISLGEGLEPGSPEATHEYTALGALMTHLAGDVLGALEQEEGTEDGPEIAYVDATPTEARLFDQFFASVLVTPAHERGMRWRGPDGTATRIKPFSNSTIEQLGTRIQSASIDVDDITEQSLFLAPASAAEQLDALATLSETLRDDLQAAVAPLRQRSPRAVVVLDRRFRRLNKLNEPYEALTRKLSAQKAMLTAAAGAALGTSLDLHAPRHAAVAKLVKESTGTKVLRTPGLIDALLPALRENASQAENPAFLTESRGQLAALEGAAPFDYGALRARFFLPDSDELINVSYRLKGRLDRFFAAHPSPLTDRASKTTLAGLLKDVRGEAVGMLGPEITAFLGEQVRLFSEAEDARKRGQGRDELTAEQRAACEVFEIVARYNDIDTPEGAERRRLDEIGEALADLGSEDLLGSVLLEEAAHTVLGRPDAPLEDLDMGAFRDAIRAARDEYERYRSKGAADGDIPERLRTLRAAYVALAEERDLVDPAVEGRTVAEALYKESQEAEHYKRLWEQVRDASERFLASSAAEGIYIGAMYSKHGRPVALFAKDEDDPHVAMVRELCTHSHRRTFTVFPSTRDRLLMVPHSTSEEPTRHLSKRVRFLQATSDDEEQRRGEVLSALLSGTTASSLIFAEAGSPEAILRPLYLAHEKGEFSQVNSAFLFNCRPVIRQLEADLESADPTPRPEILALPGPDDLNVGRTKAVLRAARIRYRAAASQDLTVPANAAEVLRAKEAMLATLRAAETKIGRLSADAHTRFVSSVHAACQAYYTRSPTYKAERHDRIKDEMKKFARAFGFEMPKSAKALG